MNELIDDFLAELELARGRSPRTIDAYRRNLHQLRDFATVAELTVRQALAPDQLRRFIAHLRENDYCPASIKQKIATLRAFAAYLREVRPDHAPESKRLNIRYRTERKVLRTLTAEQLHLLLDRLRESTEDQPDPGTTDPRHRALLRARDWALFTLLAGTGLRVGEAVGLRLQDLSLKRGEIRVRGKGGHQRIVFCDLEEIRLPLDLYLRWRETVRPAHDHLFLNGRDLGPLSTRAVQLRLRTLAKELNLPDTLTPHVLRHTYATLAVERGANLKALSQLLGHADITTTLQLYTHLSTDHLHKVFRICHPLRDNRRELPEIINDRKRMIPYFR
jgi:integrase/recombinase XerC